MWDAAFWARERTQEAFQNPSKRSELLAHDDLTQEVDGDRVDVGEVLLGLHGQEVCIVRG